MDHTGLVFKAFEFAAVRHRAQFRKGVEKVPYINHPIQVANLLVNEAGERDPALIIAAVLHDVIEDTVETLEQKQDLIAVIKEIFGEEILSIVLEVTDEKSLSKEERKRLQVVHAPFLSVKAKKLKIADKIMNVRDITTNPPDDWSKERVMEYLDWAEVIVMGMKGVSKKLEKIFDESLKAGKARYSALSRKDRES
jgi:guanosine-3',5'-bis(diphosphate) 3'-pyrophosphohydrolase